MQPTMLLCNTTKSRFNDIVSGWRDTSHLGSGNSFLYYARRLLLRKVLNRDKVSSKLEEEAKKPVLENDVDFQKFETVLKR